MAGSNKRSRSKEMNVGKNQKDLSTIVLGDDSFDEVVDLTHMDDTLPIFTSTAAKHLKEPDEVITINDSVCDTLSPTTSAHNNSLSKALECPICLEVMKDRPVVTTLCGHLFCKPCIAPMLKKRAADKKCPRCRALIKQVVDVYI